MKPYTEIWVKRGLVPSCDLHGLSVWREGYALKLAGSAALLNRFDLLGADAEAHRHARTAPWEEKLRQAAAAFGIWLDDLPARKSAEAKLCLATALKMNCSASNRWLAGRLCMGKPSSIGSLVRRFRLCGGTQTERLSRPVTNHGLTR